MIQSCIGPNGVHKCNVIKMNAACIASLLQENVSESISGIYWNQAKDLILSIIMQLFTERYKPKISSNRSVLLLRGPAQSSDLKILEKVWLFIKNQLSNHARCPSIKRENFTQGVCNVWSLILQDYIHQRNTSIPRSLQPVKKMRSYLSKY